MQSLSIRTVETDITRNCFYVISESKKNDRTLANAPLNSGLFLTRAFRGYYHDGITTTDMTSFLLVSVFFFIGFKIKNLNDWINQINIFKTTIPNFTTSPPNFITPDIYIPSQVKYDEFAFFEFITIKYGHIIPLLGNILNGINIKFKYIPTQPNISDILHVIPTIKDYIIYIRVIKKITTTDDSPFLVY